MTSLPRTRPVRRSAKRGELATTRGGKAATAKRASASASAKAAKPKAGAKAGAKGKGAKAKDAKPKSAKAKPKAASNGSGPAREPRRTPRPKPAAAAEPRRTPRPTPAAAAEPRRTPRPKPAAAEARSAATAAQAPPGDPPVAETPPPSPPKRKVPAAGYAAPTPRAEETDNAVADLVTTTVQAAQELAQIGIDVGRAALRSMLDRLPRG